MSKRQLNKATQSKAAEATNLEQEAAAICRDLDNLAAATFAKYKGLVERLSEVVGITGMPAHACGDAPTLERIDQLDQQIDAIANRVGVVGLPEPAGVDVSQHGTDTLLDRLDEISERFGILCGRIAGSDLPANPQTDESK